MMAGWELRTRAGDRRGGERRRIRLGQRLPERRGGGDRRRLLRRARDWAIRAATGG